MDERSTNWVQGKKECVERLQELTEIFSGTKQVMRVKKSGQFVLMPCIFFNLFFCLCKLIHRLFFKNASESLRKWFEDISKEITSLDIEEPNISARKVAQLVQALDEVQGL